MWDPQKVQADLKSQFGFDDLHAERVLNYSVDLDEVHMLGCSHALGFSPRATLEPSPGTSGWEFPY